MRSASGCSTGCSYAPRATGCVTATSTPWNILGSPGQAIVVDWLDACSGSPAADICRTYVLMKPPAPQLADAYLAVCEATGLATRADVFAWLPLVAAARLAEGVADVVDTLMEMVRGR